MYDYSHIKTTSPFCHEWQRISTSSRHLIIIGWASTTILISTTEALITLILGGWWRGRRSNSETTYDSLSSCDTTNTGVHLTQLITKSVKVSIHVHKLCHDGVVEAGGVAVSIQGYFDLSYASLHLMVAASMALITGKWCDSGNETEKWQRSRVIAKRKMSLSRVTVSL